MLQAGLGALILLGIYKFMNSKSDYKVDGWIAFLFILAPGIIMFLLAAGLGLANINPNYAVWGYLLYFLFPFAFLKLSLEYETKPALKYSIVVPIVAVVTEIPFVLLSGASGA